MANEENLTHKLTVSEQRAGGKASGAARRKKREIREMLEEYLAMPAKVNGKDHPTSKPVEQYDLNGNFIAEYESGVEAANALGFRASNIQRCAAARRKTAHGYKWKYKGVEWRYEYDGRP